MSVCYHTKLAHKHSCPAGFFPLLPGQEKTVTILYSILYKYKSWLATSSSFSPGFSPPGFRNLQRLSSSLGWIRTFLETNFPLSPPPRGGPSTSWPFQLGRLQFPQHLANTGPGRKTHVPQGSPVAGQQAAFRANLSGRCFGDESRSTNSYEFPGGPLLESQSSVQRRRLLRHKSAKA